MAETTVTTIIITAVKVSTFKAHEISNDPESIQVSNSIVFGFPPKATSENTAIAKTADKTNPAQVMIWAKVLR